MLASLRAKLVALLLLAIGLLPSAMAGEVLVIGHPGMGKLDGTAIQKIFTGRIVELGGSPIIAVNQPPGSPARNRFLEAFLGQDEEKYTAYWTVRRFIGKGLPPKDLSTASEIMQFVHTTPGAIAYIDAAELKPGLNILARK